MKTGPRRALVLGGGARGSFQVGMLLHLIEQRGLDFDIIRGVSVGALNAAFLAQAPLGGSARESLENLKHQVRTLYELWLGIEGNQSIYKKRLWFIGLLLGADSIYSLKPLRALLRRSVEPDKLRKSKRDFAVGTVSLVDGMYHEWKPENEHFLEKILAPATIPVAFPHVTIDKPRRDMLVDGGVRNITPLGSAFKAQPDEIYVLLTSRITEKITRADSSVQVHHSNRWEDNWLGTKVNGFDVLGRTLEILTDEIYLEDIKNALKWNTMAQQLGGGKTSRRTNAANLLKKVKRRFVKIHVLAPRVWYGEGLFDEKKLNSATEFDPTAIRKAVEHGKTVAAEKKLWVWG
jgi:NTE family protein